MKNKNVKVIDEHNIDRNANVMFALELEGSEYVVYWVERDTESNNVFVSKILKNIDGTYNMLNIDDADKKEEISSIVKTLVSTAVSDQSGKLAGSQVTLANGKVVHFVDATFNKEQYINVQKTYITTVKKDVTAVSEKYYDVVTVVPTPEVVQPAVAPAVETPVVPEPVVAPVVEEPTVVMPAVEPQAVVQPVDHVVMPNIPETPVVAPTPVQPVSVAPVVPEPVAVAPVVETPVNEPTAIQPTPVVPEPIQDLGPQPLVFNAAKENNLNAALGEVANSTTIPVENVSPVREFGVEEPIKPAAPEAPAAVVPEQPVASLANVANAVSPAPVHTKSGGFANSKFFMVVAVAFFLASCIFLGYEVFNYFQLIK